MHARLHIATGGPLITFLASRRGVTHVALHIFNRGPTHLLDSGEGDASPLQ